MFDRHKKENTGGHILSSFGVPMLHFRYEKVTKVMLDENIYRLE